MSYPEKIKPIFDDWFLEVKKDLKKKGNFWTPTLTTQGDHTRTVVLRSIEFLENTVLGVSQKVPRFIIHTDIRSQKWRQLRLDSSCSLHFYCPKRKWQMRVRGKATLSHQGPDALIEWKRLSENSKKIYTLPFTPGIEISEPQAAFQQGAPKDGLKNFGVISLLPRELDSLQLTRPNGPEYHVRTSWHLENNNYKYLAP